jgi:tetratricopeptide (TPR) repeat protein
MNSLAQGPPGVVAVGLALAVVLAVSCVNEDGRDRMSREEAAELVEAAVSAESLSYTRAADLYERALVGLEGEAPDTRIGPFTIEQLRSHATEIRGRARAEQGTVACADWVIRRIPGAAARVRLDVELAAALVEVGRRAEAVKLLGDAYIDLEKIGDEEDRDMARLELAVGWDRAGEAERADRVFQAMSGASEAVRALALLGRARSRLKAGDLSRAQALVRDAHDIVQAMDRLSRDHSWAVGQLAAAYAALDRSVETRRLIAEAAKGRGRIRALVAVADAYIESRNGGAAVYWLDEALAESTAPSAPYELATALAETAGGYGRAGDLERAQALLGQALEVARQLDVLGSERAGALSKIARKYAAIGDDTHALMIANVLLEDGSSDQAWALAGVALALADAGKFDAAVPPVFDIPGRDVRRLTLAGVLVSHVAAAGDQMPGDTFVLHRILEEFH